MLGQCERCPNPVRVGGTGRTRKYCSNACRQAAWRDRGAPKEMRDQPRWLRRHGKMPLTVTGKPASSTDPRTWTTYSTANRSKVGQGLGFALGDGIGCIDLDHCFDGDTLAPWAVEVLELCPPTYIERSMSKTGLHIFGRLAPRKGVRIRDGRDIEIYSAGRYIAITSDTFAGSSNRLGDLTEVVERLTDKGSPYATAQEAREHASPR